MPFSPSGKAAPLRAGHSLDGPGMGSCSSVDSEGLRTLSVSLLVHLSTYSSKAVIRTEQWRRLVFIMVAVVMVGAILGLPIVHRDSIEYEST